MEGHWLGAPVELSTLGNRAGFWISVVHNLAHASKPPLGAVLSPMLHSGEHRVSTEWFPRFGCEANAQF